jgi:hypothetical protein
VIILIDVIFGGGLSLALALLVLVWVVQKILQEHFVIDVYRVLNVINLKWVIFALIRQGVFKM